MERSRHFMSDEGSMVIGHQGTPGLCSSSLLQSLLDWPFGHALEGDQYHSEKPCRWIWPDGPGPHRPMGPQLCPAPVGPALVCISSATGEVDRLQAFFSSQPPKSEVSLPPVPSARHWGEGRATFWDHPLDTWQGHLRPDRTSLLSCPSPSASARWWRRSPGCWACTAGAKGLGEFQQMCWGSQKSVLWGLHAIWRAALPARKPLTSNWTLWSSSSGGTDPHTGVQEGCGQRRLRCCHFGGVSSPCAP